MSTTTDASITESPGSGAALLLRAGKLAAAAFAYFTEISPIVIVFGPQATTMGAMSRSDTRVLEGGPGFIVVQGSGHGFVRKLYSEGAWLVMPSNLDGCGLGSYLREKFGRAKA